MDTESKEERQDMELDGFSRFMFGPRHRMHNGSGMEDNQEGKEPSGKRRGDWILGRQERETDSSPREEPREPGQIEKLLDGVDLGQLMDNIDTLMTSAGQLKPLFKKVTPLFQQLLKKVQ
jgi:hypothetical protein